MPDLAPDSIPNIPNDTGGAGKDAPATLTIRALASPFKKTQMIEHDGGLLIKGVPMLAAGTWTDSAVGTPLNYPEDTLREYAGNWLDTTGWSRHLGGVPRDVTDKVADLRNPHYENGAVTGDIFVHGATQKSRDLMELVKRKLISFVSVEHGGDERYNPETRHLEATSITFTGFAFVNKGACTKCRLNEQPTTPRIEPPTVAPKEDIMETKELESKIAALEAKNKELEDAVKAKPEVKAEVPKELAEAAGIIKSLSERLEKLEKAPAPTVTAAVVEDRELGTVETVAVWDKKTGYIRGV